MYQFCLKIDCLDFFSVISRIRSLAWVEVPQLSLGILEDARLDRTLDTATASFLFS